MVLGGVVLNGIGSLHYTGTSILMSQPDHGALISEYALNGGVNRTFGALRRTGHEDDPEVHLALNSGLPLVDPRGGFVFVFQTGEPVFRRYDQTGKLIFERHIEARDRRDRREANRRHGRRERPGNRPSRRSTAQCRRSGGESG